MTPQEHMPFLPWVEDEDAEDEIGQLYAAWKAANPGREQMPGILKCFSGSVPFLKGILDISYPLQFSDGALTQREKEMIATYVSALNQCPY
jgi:hypothetical protein